MELEEFSYGSRVKLERLRRPLGWLDIEDTISKKYKRRYERLISTRSRNAREALESEHFLTILDPRLSLEEKSKETGLPETKISKYIRGLKAGGLYPPRKQEVVEKLTFEQFFREYLLPKLKEEYGEGIVKYSTMDFSTMDLVNWAASSVFYDESNRDKWVFHGREEARSLSEITDLVIEEAMKFHQHWHSDEFESILRESTGEEVKVTAEMESAEEEITRLITEAYNEAKDDASRGKFISEKYYLPNYFRETFST